jgi:hypothetical protein
LKERRFRDRFKDGQDGGSFWQLRVLYGFYQQLGSERRCVAKTILVLEPIDKIVPGLLANRRVWRPEASNGRRHLGRTAVPVNNSIPGYIVGLTHG